MITIKEVIDKSTHFLEQRGVSSPRRQAEEVVSLSLLKSRLDLYMEFQKPLTEKELQGIRENLKRRANKEPCQYIEGKISFYNCELRVDPRVLIPRQETEIMVDLIVQQLQKEPCTNQVLWDICTGSGAIAIALKKRFPQLRVVASDLSKQALELARENGDLNKVDIEWREGDLLEPFEGERADFVVSNPPYISQEEYESLEAEVKHYEPRLSLVAKQSGFDFYHRYANDLKKHLKPHAKAWFEIGYNQGKKIKEIFKNQGFDKAYFEKDYSSNDRFFFLELE